MISKIRKLKLQPAQVIIAGFFLLVLAGAIILYLPVSTHPDKHISFIDAFFTSTSAVCVTGLVVVDTGSTFTLFGQIIILLLIQAGGLGFMTVTSLAFIFVRKRITLSERLIIKESLNEFNLSGLVNLIRKILMVTLIAELAGAAVFSTRFIPLFGLKGVYLSVFHSVSAFCNAGFDVFGTAQMPFQSLTQFSSDPVILITTMLLIVIGGLGFVVVTNVFDPKRIASRQRISRYSKLVLISTGILTVLGFIIAFSLEINNPKTLGDSSLDTGSRIMGGLFQSVSPRTAGFNTIDQNAMMPATKLFVMILMFIGASPAGTGGGIKTTTAAVVLISVFAFISGRKDSNIMGRRIAEDIAKRAAVIFTLSLLLVLASVFALLAIEGTQSPLTAENIIFEAVSAFGTVGLSAGITPALSAASRIIIMVVMFCGRIGLMTLVFAFAIRSQNNHVNIRYPEERFMVG